MSHLEIREDLTLRIGRASVRVSPRQGLHLAERLTRASFRRMLNEEAVAVAPDFDPDATEEALQ